MRTVSRRTYLGIAGGALSLGLAGCTDTETEFLVTNTQLIHQNGDDRFDYPDDILIRVAVENTRPSRQEGTLELTLRHDPGTGEDDVETWTKTDDIELAQGTTKQYHYRFQNVFETGNDLSDYTVEGTIIQESDGD